MQNARLVKGPSYSKNKEPRRPVGNGGAFGRNLPANEGINIDREARPTLSFFLSLLIAVLRWRETRKPRNLVS